MSRKHSKSPYIIGCKEAPPKKTLFLNNVNSYLGNALARKLLNSFKEENEEIWYDVFGTLQDGIECSSEIRFINILNHRDESFMNAVASCEIIIFDISHELTDAKKFFKYFEHELENARIKTKKQIILVSTIMTWAQTQQSSIISDASYRKRRPHPCFTSHLALERDVINLSKKHKELVSSVVVCPGAVYGENQDIFHFIYKKCYSNDAQLDIFAPGTNYIPVIHVKDFTEILKKIIRNPPESRFSYILAVQPEPMEAKHLITVLAEAVGGPETRIKLCSKEEIFLMDEEIMTVSFHGFCS